jgi:hypothetical protein
MDSICIVYLYYFLLYIRTLFRKRISTDKNGMSIETVYIVYHYILRKAIDYIEYKDKWMRINAAVNN